MNHALTVDRGTTSLATVMVTGSALDVGGGNQATTNKFLSTERMTRCNQHSYNQRLAS
jgi:hypothetical protein